VSTTEPPTSPSTRSGLSTGLGRILLRDLPYIAMLVLGIGGVAFRSFSGGPILLYWQILLPLFGVMCVLAGWPAASTSEQRQSLIWTQALHRAAFMLVTYALSMKQLRGVLNDNAMALALLALLALSTFVAGVHARAWRICVIGIVMGLFRRWRGWIKLQYCSCFALRHCWLLFLSSGLPAGEPYLHPND
jgi:hypothetical protein